MDSAEPLFDLRASKGYRWLFGVGAVFFIGLGVVPPVMMLRGDTPGERWAWVALSLVSFGFVAGGVGSALAAVRLRLRIWTDRVEWRGAWRRKAMRWADAEGYRLLTHGSVPILRVEARSVAKNGDGVAKERAVSFELTFERRDEMLAWVAEHLPNLALREHEAEVRELLADETLGVSQEQRVYRLARLRRGAWFINGGFGALAVVMLFYRGGWESYAWMMGALVAAPYVALAYVIATDKQVVIDGPPGSLRPTVGVTLILPGIVLGARAVLDWAWLGTPEVGFWVAGLAFGVVLATAIWFAAPDARSWGTGARLAQASFALFAGAHGLGTAGFVNGRFDNTPETREATRVVGRRENGGKHPEYFIRVRPAVMGAAKSELKVGRGFYRAIREGDTVVVVMRNGRLGGAWYRVEIGDGR